MLLHTLWCLDVERVVNFESLMLLGPLHTKVLVIDVHSGLNHTDGVTDTPTLVSTRILIRELGLELLGDRERVLEGGLLSLVRVA
jgi:hypothetical protein